jgi:hypothetical protein
MRYDQGGKMPEKTPSVRLEIKVPNQNPTDEELRTAILAAVNTTQFVTALRNAHTSSKTVDVTSHKEFGK